MTATAPARIAINHEQFTALYFKHRGMVLAVIKRIVRRPNDIEDIAQNVWLLASTRQHQFDRRAAYTTWLGQIAVRESLTFLRRVKARPLYCESDLYIYDQPSVLETVLDQGPSVEDAVAGAMRHSQNAAIVSRLMRGLPPKYREPIQLEYFEELRQDEAANILGISHQAFKLRLMRAKRVLRERATGLSRTAGGAR